MMADKKVDLFEKRELTLIHSALVGAVKAAQRVVVKYPVGSALHGAAQEEVVILERLRSKVQSYELEF